MNRLVRLTACALLVGLPAGCVVSNGDDASSATSPATPAADPSATTVVITTVATTTVATTTTTVSEAVDPATLPPELAALEVAPEAPRDGYSRALFRHWIDADGDGCNTRCEVLDAERVAVLPGLPNGGWVSAWDGYSTPDPSELDIDHTVALAEAWDSGAGSWDASMRQAFANDLDLPDTLIAVTASSNRSKGDRDPADWQPPNQGAWCQFGRGWIAIKAKWHLTADPAEVAALANLLRGC